MEKLGEIFDRIPPLLRKGEKIFFATIADITEDGSFGERWLIVTDRRFMIYTPKLESRCEIPLDSIGKVEVVDHIGNTHLYIEANGVSQPVMFSKVLADECHKLSSVIQELISSGMVHGSYPMVSSEFDEKQKTRGGNKKAFLHLLSFLSPFRNKAVVGLLLSVGATVASLMPPYFQKVLIDDILTPGQFNLLLPLIFILLGVNGAIVLLGALQKYVLTDLGQRVVSHIRITLFEHLEKLSLGFYDRMNASRIFTRITDDVSRVRWVLVDGLPMFIINFLTISGIGIILFSWNWRLAIYVLLPVPLIVYGILRFHKKSHPLYHRVWRKSADLSTQLVDTIYGSIVVKSFAQEKSEVGRLRQTLGSLVRANMDATVTNLKFFPLLNFTGLLAGVIIWWLGGQNVLQNEMKLGDLVAFMTFMVMFYNSIQTITGNIPTVQESITSGERIFELLSVEPDIKDPLVAKDTFRRGGIKIENLTFGYDPYIPILKDLNIEIRPGEAIGIVGPSGSGKTTLTKLLMRFYDPFKGRILVDGIDLKEIRGEALRREIGIVLQDPFLFHGSIAGNIAYGKVKGEPEEIIASAKVANAHEFVMGFPLAYDTHTGERGSKLSGGERQRLAIARAVITDPKILILDEATSSVDTLSEREIQQSLDRLIEERTTIVIAHRLSTLKRADRIVVMDKGKFAEVGTHSELLERNGLYARLHEAQLKDQEVKRLDRRVSHVA